jgi:hypothetical protein
MVEDLDQEGRALDPLTGIDLRLHPIDQRGIAESEIVVDEMLECGVVQESVGDKIADCSQTKI